MDGRTGFEDENRGTHWNRFASVAAGGRDSLSLNTTWTRIVVGVGGFSKARRRIALPIDCCRQFTLYSSMPPTSCSSTIFRFHLRSKVAVNKPEAAGCAVPAACLSGRRVRMPQHEDERQYRHHAARRQRKPHRRLGSEPLLHGGRGRRNTIPCMRNGSHALIQQVPSGLDESVPGHMAAQRPPRRGCRHLANRVCMSQRLPRQ